MTRFQNVAIIATLLISFGTLYLVISTLDIFNFSPSDGDKSATEFAIVTIERRDLSEYKDVNGILEYGDTYEVAPSQNGVITYVASQGSELDRGSVIFRVYKSISNADILSSDQQIASANSAVAQAELALENLNEPASAAQIASADASVSDAQLSSATSESGVDLAAVSLRISRKSFCDRAYDIDTPSWVHVDPICPDSDVILNSSAIKTLLANMFTSTDNILVTRSNSLLNAYQNYVSSVGFSESAERSLSIAITNRAALDELPSEKQITQATESLKSAREQRAALDELPVEKQLVQLNASLDAAKTSLSIAVSVKGDLIEGSFATVLMFGDIPVWRDFKEGMSPGEDIKQLEENLLALGYVSSDSFSVDNKFDIGTVEAIEKMQNELNLVIKGEIDFGEVVFSPGKSIVEASSSFPSIGTYVTTDSVAVSLTPIERTQMEISPLGKVSTRTESLQRVSTSLEVSSQDLIEVGSEVNIELPDESVVKGRVIDIGNVAVLPQSGQSGDPYLEVSVAMEEDLSLPEWTGATVTVSITKELAENVLSVPVTSLLALLDGGYALEVQESGSITKLVPVKTGIYADGWVEVTGQGLEAGTEVVMPK